MKEITLPVGELKTALAGFNKVVSRGTSLPVLGCIRLQPAPDGVDLQITDLDSFATYRIPTNVPADFLPCLISMAALARIVKTRKDWLWLIHEGAQRFKTRHFIGEHPVEQPIDSLPIEEWPLAPQIKSRPFVVEPAFKESFNQALECSSSESTRQILNGVCLDLTRPDCHCVVGTDGRHLFAANTFHFPLAGSVVVPNRKFFGWPGFTDDGDWLLALEPPVEGKEPRPAYIQVQSEHWTFLTRGIEGTYPNWRQVMPSANRNAARVHLTDDAVAAVLEALPRMPGFDDSSQPVVLAVHGGKLALCSRSKHSDHWTEVPVPGTSAEGPDQRVCLNRSFVTKGLRFGFTELEIENGISPVLFTGPGKTMIVMPMRLDDPPVPSEPTQPSSQPEVTPAETAEAATPSAVQPENPTEPHTAMATTNNITALPAPERASIKSNNGNGSSNGETGTGLKAVVDQVERIKVNLRDMISDLNDTLDLLKAAEKEKKATLKEVESIRAALRSLQKVEF